MMIIIAGPIFCNLHFSFKTYFQSMFNMTARFLKDNIDGVCATQFQFGYIVDTTAHLHKYFVNLCQEVHFMLWGNQELKLQ